MLNFAYDLDAIFDQFWHHFGAIFLSFWSILASKKRVGQKHNKIENKKMQASAGDAVASGNLFGG